MNQNLYHVKYLSQHLKDNIELKQLFGTTGKNATDLLTKHIAVKTILKSLCFNPIESNKIEFLMLYIQFLYLTTPQPTGTQLKSIFFHKIKITDTRMGS